MPKAEPKAEGKQYRVLRMVSCRVSTDPESPDYDNFVDWQEGDVIDLAKAPTHLNVKFLLSGDPAIEEVTSG